jgi:hypothetical protein
MVIFSVRYVNVYQRVPLLTVLSEVMLSDSYHGDDRYDSPWVLIRLEGLSNDKNSECPSSISQREMFLVGTLGVYSMECSMAVLWGY